MRVCGTRLVPSEEETTSSKVCTATSRPLRPAERGLQPPIVQSGGGGSGSSEEGGDQEQRGASGEGESAARGAGFISWVWEFPSWPSG